MKVLLYSPQYRPNMSSMIRTAEFYGLKQIYIYDANGLLTVPDSKKGRANMQHMARVWTAGAIHHIDIIKVEDPSDFIAKYSGRVVGTVLSDEAVNISEATVLADDLLIFGPEREGLPETIAAQMDMGVCIPNIGHTDCLNVAVSFGIVVHHWLTLSDK